MPEYYEMIDGGEGNVYHVLFYMISNFLIADISQDIVYYYPNKKNCPVIEGFLALLPPNFTRQLEKTPGIQYQSFMNAIPYLYDIVVTESYALLRKLFAPHMKPLQPGKKIYIWRKNTECRTCANEQEVQNCVQQFGYEIVCMEDHSIVEQIRMISEAETIVGLHGAGLAMTVFCNQNAGVIEINPDTNTKRRHFYHIALTLRHKYFRFQDVEVLSTEQEVWKVNVPELVHILSEWHEYMADSCPFLVY